MLKPKKRKLHFTRQPGNWCLDFQTVLSVDACQDRLKHTPSPRQQTDFWKTRFYVTRKFTLKLPFLLQIVFFPYRLLLMLSFLWWFLPSPHVTLVFRGHLDTMANGTHVHGEISTDDRPSMRKWLSIFLVFVIVTGSVGIVERIIQGHGVGMESELRRFTLFYMPILMLATWRIWGSIRLAQRQSHALVAWVQDTLFVVPEIARSHTFETAPQTEEQAETTAFDSSLRSTTNHISQSGI